MRDQFVKHIIGATVVAAISGVALLAVGSDDPEHVKRIRDTKQCLECDLRNADLKGIDVEKGMVRKADFRHADLYKANFREADLTDAQFTGANLHGADLTGAKGANLAGALTNEYTICPTGAAGPCNQ